MSLAETAASVDDAFTSIPIIDLGECGTPEGKSTTACQIRDACVRVGFFYIRNHGIPQSCFDRVLTAMQTYFSLPMETKMKLHHRSSSRFRGYSPPLDLNVDPDNNDKGDFHEGFIIGREDIQLKADDEKTANGDILVGANVWPSDDYPEFREPCLEYYHAAVNVGKILFSLFALALELPETYFDDKMQHLESITMKPLHYPLREGHLAVDDSTSGIGAHSDYECFTILWQQPEIQALQVMNTQKQWIDAPPIKDTLVINVGDLLGVWTNDVFKSTVHRAVNKSGKERYSIPTFFGIDYHVNVEPIPSCVSVDRPAKYKPVTAGDYVNMRLKDALHIT